MSQWEKWSSIGITGGMFIYKDTMYKAVGGYRGASGKVQEPRLGAAQMSAGRQRRRILEGGSLGAQASLPWPQPALGIQGAFLQMTLGL